MAVMFFLATLATPTARAEQRCGLYVNPTPGNLLLLDKDGRWWITSQGETVGPDAKGRENVPAFDENEFVETQGDHGYGCACLAVETNAGGERITRVISGKVIPLARCRTDISLPRPD